MKAKNVSTVVKSQIHPVNLDPSVYKAPQERKVSEGGANDSMSSHKIPHTSVNADKFSLILLFTEPRPTAEGLIIECRVQKKNTEFDIRPA